MLLYPHFCLFSKPSACIISFLFHRHPRAALHWNQTPGLSCPNSQERSNEKLAVLPQLILRTTLRLVLLSKARFLRKTCDLLAVKELVQTGLIPELLTTQLHCFLWISPRSALPASTCVYGSFATSSNTPHFLPSLGYCDRICEPWKFLSERCYRNSRWGCSVGCSVNPPS